jgi:hypothetical protein
MFCSAEYYDVWMQRQYTRFTHGQGASITRYKNISLPPAGSCSNYRLQNREVEVLGTNSSASGSPTAYVLHDRT